MSQGASRNQQAQYLVRSRRPMTLAPVLDFIASSPSIDVTNRIGPSNEPHTLVLSMTDEDAALLQQRFTDQLIVERDRPLNLFGGG